jgi:hypothetical protein
MRIFALPAGPRAGNCFASMAVIRYFSRIRAPKLVLWCYLAWYAAISACYFDSSPVIWLSAIGMSAVIGIALIFATKVPGQAMDRWTMFRLFLFPFCVSSYSALIKGKGFFLIFPTEPRPLLTGLSACAAMLLFQAACRWLAAGKSRDPGIA